MKHFNLAVVLVGSLVYATSGVSGQSHQHGHSQPPAKQAPTPKVEIDLDLQFLHTTALEDGMTLEASLLAEQKAEDPDLKGLAIQIAHEQRRALDYLDRLRARLYPNTPKPEPMSGTKMADLNDMTGEVGRLRNLNGKAFDQAFAEVIIRHREMRAPMSERAAKEAKHDEVRALAKESLIRGKKNLEDLQKFARSAK